MSPDMVVQPSLKLKIFYLLVNYRKWINTCRFYSSENLQSFHFSYDFYIRDICMGFSQCLKICTPVNFYPTSQTD